MPQINQLADVLYSQLFWLALTLAVIYFGIGKAMLPKILGTMDARDSRIADDLAAAQVAREAADATEEAYRARVLENRTEAAKLTAAAKSDAARATEAQVAKADEKIRGKVEKAEARLRAATDAALADIENVAAEAAQDMVTRLAGVSVSKADAAQAVKAALRQGSGQALANG
ncbi:ATPase [Sphingosinicella sp. LHD-64]|uniref:F0F1 ATP synthase subunit B family protein n=1 Tax=Sphingosinicella sp. LHD-64 TaxID=3072139 RepID=UPI00280F5051|nr:ATPase [Sphingosinicella sp. LHD-64]MDQ8756406.1 ATPase [Sphingosinicella sp. LHD-64]